MKALLFGDEARINYRTIGLVVDDTPWPLLVVTPHFYAVQVSGPTVTDHPITRMFLNVGFTRLSDQSTQEGPVLPEAAEGWSGHLRSNGSWWIERQGKLFKERQAPEPQWWVDQVRAIGHVIVYYVPEHVGEISAVQTVEALQENQGLVVVVPMSK